MHKCTKSPLTRSELTTAASAVNRCSIIAVIAVANSPDTRSPAAVHRRNEQYSSPGDRRCFTRLLLCHTVHPHSLSTACLQRFERVHRACMLLHATPSDTPEYTRWILSRVDWYVTNHYYRRIPIFIIIITEYSLKIDKLCTYFQRIFTENNIHLPMLQSVVAYTVHCIKCNFQVQHYVRYNYSTSRRIDK